MFSNLQISRTLAKNKGRMEKPAKAVSENAMQAEWQEVMAAQREPREFRPLYDRYYEPIFRFIYRRTSNEQVSADICSQVFLKAMQKLHSYSYKGVPFSAWLYRIASNEIAQYFRDNAKSRVVSIEDKQLNTLFEEIDENEREDHQNALIKALDRLNPDQLQLIELRFFERRPFKEIADILAITESNAKVKTYRILDKLKKIIVEFKNEDS